MGAPLHLPVVDDMPARPATRAACLAGGENEARPCPFVSCTEHLIHGVMLGQGGAPLSDDELVAMLATMPATCVLDVAAEGGGGGQGDAGTLLGIGVLWDLTRERIRQIEAKALGALERRVTHLRDDLDEDPSPELRPAPAGAVRVAEGRVAHEAPPQHARLATPATVARADEAMWCPWIGSPLTGGLCARRHAARTRGSATTSGSPRSSFPVYPACARCEDGAAVAARLGVDAPVVPLRTVLRPDVAKIAEAASRLRARPAAIDWLGEGDADPEPAPAPAHAHDAAEERREEEIPVSKKVTKAPDPVRAATAARLNAARITAPAPGSVCAVKGCDDPPGGYQEKLSPALRDLCATHRQRAQWRKTKTQCTPEEARAWLLKTSPITDGVVERTAARAVEPPTTAPSPSPVVARAESIEVDDDRELAEIRAQLAAVEGERALLVAERDAIRADLAAVTAARDAARERVDEVEGQLLAVARADFPASPAQVDAILAPISRAVFDGDDRAWPVEALVGGIELLWERALAAEEPRDHIAHIERVWLATSRWDEGIDVSTHRAEGGGWAADLFELPADDGADPDVQGAGASPAAALADLRAKVDARARARCRVSPATIAHVAFALGCLATLGAVVCTVLYLRERRAHDRARAACADAGELYRDVAKRLDDERARADAAETRLASEALAAATHAPPPEVGPDALTFPPEVARDVVDEIVRRGASIGPVMRIVNDDRAPWPARSPVILHSERGRVVLPFAVRVGHA